MVIPSLTFVYDRRGRGSKTTAAQVELVVYADKKRKYITTGVKLFPKEWSHGEVSACREDYEELNEQLRMVKRKTREIITRMISENALNLDALPKILAEELQRTDNFIDFARERARWKYSSISAGTKEHYELFLRFLEDWKGIVYFSDVTENNILNMDKVLKKKGLKEQSRWNYHKFMKYFILQAMEDGLIKRNPYSRLDIKRGNESGLTRYLTPEEFHRFETCIIKDKCLERVRDVFVFQTYTMMSYSDLAEFDYKKCISVNGRKVYKSKRTKTGQEFMVVLLEPAIQILKKYKNKLPIISNVKYNAYLKIAVNYAQIDKAVTTHWARHTGATLLLNEGNVPMHIVQHILGHSTIRETERTYAKVLDKTIVDSMVNYERV